MEDEKEFGEFGEIAIRSCFMCGKTFRKSSCHEFQRSVLSASIGSKTKHSICLKCLLEGIYSVCKDKKTINEYLDLFIKVGITEGLNQNV